MTGMKSLNKQLLRGLLLSCILPLFYCGISREVVQKVVAVPSFSNTSKVPIEANLIHSISDEFIVSLVQTKKFAVTERKKLDSLLQEHALEQKGLLETENAIKIGKMLKAKYIILCSISKINILVKNNIPDIANIQVYNANLDGDIEVTARMIDIEKGIIIAASKKETKVFENYNRVGNIQKNLVIQELNALKERMIQKGLSQLTDSLARDLADEI